MQLLDKYLKKPKTQEEKDFEYAKEISSKLSTKGTRKKAYADIVGVMAILEYLRNNGFDCKIHRSLHKNPKILEEFAITDIYYNNYRIDVITNYNTNITKIPKCHADYDIMADFYIIIKLSPNLKDFRILGYVKPDDVIMSYHDDKYYYPNKRLPIKDLFNVMLTDRKSLPELIGKHAECESLFLRYLEGELSYSYKKTFIQHLTTCESCTKRFNDFCVFHYELSNSSRFPSICQTYYDKISTVNPALYKKIGYSNIPKRPAGPFRKNYDNLPIFEKIFKFLDKYAWDENTTSSEFSSKKEYIDYAFKDKFNIDMEHITNILFERKKVVFLIGIVVVAFVSILLTFVIAGSASSDLAYDEDQIETAENAYEKDKDLYTDYAPLPSSGASEKTISDNGLEYSPVDYKGDDEIIEAVDAVKKISWEVPESIKKDNEYVKFLQVAGKNIKLNLQNELILTRDVPKNKNIKVDIQFSGVNSIVGLKMVKSSGSNSIDEIIQNGIFETFNYMKPPKQPMASVDLTLVIEL